MGNIKNKSIAFWLHPAFNCYCKTTSQLTILDNWYDFIFISTFAQIWENWIWSTSANKFGELGRVPFSIDLCRPLVRRRNRVDYSIRKLNKLLAENNLSKTQTHYTQFPLEQNIVNLPKKYYLIKSNFSKRPQFCILSKMVPVNVISSIFQFAMN